MVKHAVRGGLHGEDKMHATLYIFRDDEPEVFDFEHVVGIFKDEAEAEIVGKIIVLDGGGIKASQFWREEFEHVRTDRNNETRKRLDAEERVEQGHLREGRLMRNLEAIVETALQQATHTIRCRLCGEFANGSDPRKIAHGEGCPIPEAITLTHYQGQAEIDELDAKWERSR